MAEPPATTALKRTPLYDLHVRLGARMVPFAGYDMPVQYPGGIIKEHLHTRAAAGLFDVSHMGQIALRPRSGRIEDAARALETLVPGDMLGLAAGRQRYTLFTNAAGGVLDDLMVSNQGDHLLLVVNAARKEADEAHLRAHLSGACEIEPLADRALVALQGPAAEAALARLAPEVRAMRFMDARVGHADGRGLHRSPAPAIPARTASRSACRRRRPEHCARRCCAMRRSRRSGSGRATACGSKRACAFTAPTSTRRPRRSRRRWNGRSRRRAAPAVRARAAFPAPR